MGEREKLPNDRIGTTAHFTILAREEDHNGSPIVREVKGYITLNAYEDGRLGELFIRIGKAGSSEAWMDAWAVQCSLALQHGATIETVFQRCVGQRFEPSGVVKWLPGVERCTSLIDMVARFILSKTWKKETTV